MEGYLGQVCRSRSWAKVNEPVKGELKNTAGRNMTWDVFKTYVFFFLIELVGSCSTQQLHTGHSGLDKEQS